MSSSGIAVGREKGYPVEKRSKVAKPSRAKAVSGRNGIETRLGYWYFFNVTKQRLSKRTAVVRDLVSEVVGYAPYEKRLLDMLKTGGASAEKRMYKFAKKRVSISVHYYCEMKEWC